MPLTDEALKNVKMYYFGCVERAGHFLWDKSLSGRSLSSEKEPSLPWNPDRGEVDGVLQHHSDECKKRAYCGCGSSTEGKALVHHKNGWTALSFWDRSVDSRGGCNSTFFAQGDFTFDDMVQLAKVNFPSIWNRYKFSVVEVKR